MTFNTGMHGLCVFLIDDHPLFRSGLRMIIQKALGQAQIHEMDTLEEALSRDMQPELVVLDIFLADINGLTGIAPIKARWPQSRVMVISSDDSSETLQRALNEGADAFLSKAQSPAHILETIRGLLPAGGSSGPATDTEDASNAPPVLSDRQRQVLELLAQGMSNRMIGQRLFLSEHTIRWHVQSLLEALGASSRTEAVFLARQQGLIP